MSPAKAGKLPTEKQARDLDYETPRRVLDRVDFYFGGQIPFDPATTIKNPTNAIWETNTGESLLDRWLQREEQTTAAFEKEFPSEDLYGIGYPE